uniref:Uncharacterized protein n=1 Tax=Moniliophthora roreri TaxID=221103 RepID=A0A0W0FDH9_MONRR
MSVSALSRIIASTTLLFTTRSSAFLISAPSRVTSLAGTSFSWTWEAKDPDCIGIWVSDSSGECPLPNDSDNPDSKELEIVVDRINWAKAPDSHIPGQKGRSGSDLIKIQGSGSVTLCAFSYQGSAASPSNVSFLNASAPISVGPITDTTTTCPPGSQVSTTVTETTSVSSVVFGAPDNKGFTSSSARATAITIVAIAVTVTLLVLPIIFILFRRRRHQRLPLAESSEVSPYPVIQFSSAPTRKEGYNRTSECDTLDSIISQMQEEQDASSSSPTSTRELTTHGTDFSPQQEERQRRIIYHDDSGWRPPAISSTSESNEGHILEMPPDYVAAL